LLKYTLVDCLGPNSRIEKGEEWNLEGQSKGS
jgi:hypothetical protein